MGHDSAFKDRNVQLQSVRVAFIPTQKTDIRDLGPMDEVVGLSPGLLGFSWLCKARQHFGPDLSCLVTILLHVPSGDLQFGK